ncbi:MAG TPA: hypothetical protein VLW47_06100, partial [Thermodesulfobacteriota bacterium]|nr:hypothetical protein [Thermodesulfobacteriota bacterium]
QGEALMRCHRCNGIMVSERFYGPGGWRCVLCGEVFDLLIWENRNHSRGLEIGEDRGGQRGRKKRR